MKTYLKLFSLALVLMYCLSQLVAADFNDTNINGCVGEEQDNETSIDVINSTPIKKLRLMKFYKIQQMMETQLISMYMSIIAVMEMIFMYSLTVIMDIP